MSMPKPAVVASRCARSFALLAVVTLSAHAELAENPLRDAYFGETHVHTAYSLDAYLGGTRLTPSDAYRQPRWKSSIR